MRTKNKMKDSEVEYEEWWEVAKECLKKSWRKNCFNLKLMNFF